MSKVKCAVTTFEKGFSCSQAIFSCYSEDFGLGREIALKIATGFGGGMHRGKTCGAVTGAIMVIGLKYGMGTIEDAEAKEATYKLVDEFSEEFEQRNGSVVCKDLLGCDLYTPEGRSLMKEKNLLATRCVKFVQDAVDILDKIL